MLQNLKHLLYLTDHTIFTPLELKQNTNTFTWYLKMPNIFQKHKDIIIEKTAEYQEALKKRMEVFIRDLEVYWDQVIEYEKWGDIKLLGRYRKKATILDNK